jgi:Mn2+/Fe2+ NRAMP family transporter
MHHATVFAQSLGWQLLSSLPLALGAQLLSIRVQAVTRLRHRQSRKATEPPPYLISPQDTT